MTLGAQGQTGRKFGVGRSYQRAKDRKSHSVVLSNLLSAGEECCCVLARSHCLLFCVHDRPFDRRFSRANRRKPKNESRRGGPLLRNQLALPSKGFPPFAHRPMGQPERASNEEKPKNKSKSLETRDHPRENRERGTEGREHSKSKKPQLFFGNFVGPPPRESFFRSILLLPS